MIIRKRKVFYFLLIGNILFIAYLFYSYNLANEQRAQYPTIEKDSKIEGIVLKKNKVFNIFNKGTIFNISSKENFNASWIKNNTYKDSYLEDFLHIGDSIYKKKNNDTLYVFKDTIIYYFLID